MKKYLFYLLLFALTITSCKGQSIISQTPNKLKQDKLKELLFNEKFENSTIYSNRFKLPDGNDMRKIEDMNYYIFIITHPDSPYGAEYIYFKNPIQLKSECNKFYSASIGILKEYDIQGNLIKEINFDAGFGFSLQNVIDKMQADYKIDLLHPPKGLYRDLERNLAKSNAPPTYKVVFDDNKIDNRRIIVLNGNTGELISDNYILFVDN